jgi:Domain of unknown function (DUF4136)
MRLNPRIAFFPALLILVTAAFTQEVHYNYDRGTNFAGYETYQFINASESAPKAHTVAAPPKADLPTPPSGLPAPPSNLLAPLPGPPTAAAYYPNGAADLRANGAEDPLIDQEIKRAIDEQLAHKGLTRVERNGDLQVIYHVALRQEMSISLFGSGWPQRAYGGWPNGFVQGETSTIPIGTLVVDLYDPVRKQLIWRGGATKSIELKKDPDKNYKNLQKSLAKLFKNYPPQPGK